MINPKDLIQEYHETYVKERYPDIKLNQTETICRYIFKFVKNKIKEGRLKNIRLKYLGIFIVFPGNVIRMINTLEKPSIYLNDEAKFELKKKIKKHVENNSEKFEKYENLNEIMNSWRI